MYSYTDIMLMVAGGILPLHLLARFLFLRRRRQKVMWPREILLALFVAFMAGLLVLVMRPGGRLPTLSSLFSYAHTRLVTYDGINFVPFHTIRRLIAYTQPTGAVFLVNIVGNVVMFMPWGFCLPLLWRRWQPFYKLFAAALLLPVCIESLQLFIARSVDVDDVILNTCGALCGYALYKLAAHLFPRLKKLAV